MVDHDGMLHHAPGDVDITVRHGGRWRSRVMTRRLEVAVACLVPVAVAVFAVWAYVTIGFR